MNPIYRFYQAVLRTLNKREWSDEDVEKIRKLATDTPGLSPHFKDDETLTDVFDDSIEEVELCDVFIAAAFKDLSSLKTLAAQRLFSRITKRLHYDNGFAAVFTSDVKKGKVGSATVVLQVSDLKEFERIFNDIDGIKGSFAFGALICET